MRHRGTGLLLVSIVAACALAWAGEPGESSRASRARQLEENATRLASLFRSGQPPLRMTASITTYDFRGHESGTGSYVLDWAGPTRWAEEIRIGELVSSRGVSDDRSWYRDSVSPRSIRIEETRQLLGPRLFEQPPAVEEATKLRERALDGAPAACVRWRRGGDEREACYDLVTGVLLREDRRPESGITTFRRDSAHAPFHEVLYPRVRVIGEDGRPSVEARDVVLSDLQDVSPGGFLPLVGATVSPWCEGLRVPERLHRVTPEFPASARAARIRGRVTVEAHVREDGTVENVLVIRSLTPDTDAAVVRAIGQWRYRPMLCGTRPVSFEWLIDTSFWVQ